MPKTSTKFPHHIRRPSSNMSSSQESLRGSDPTIIQNYDNLSSTRLPILDIGQYLGSTG